MIFDTHLHTVYSTDSRMKLSDAIDKAKQAGIGIIVTEHMDLEYPQPQSFLFDVNRYFDEYGRYRSPSVLLGIEIGMRGEQAADNRAIALGHPFDFIIGSVHVVDGIDVYSPEFYQEYTKRQVYHRYFASMLTCIKSYEFIDSLGHIDYICRYARFNDAEIHYSEFKDLIDPVLQELAAKEKAIEINTRRLDKREVIEVLIPIYKRFVELGGRIATIGSDAHLPHDIGKGLDAGAEIAERSGLRAVWFCERKPQYVKV